MAPVNGHGLSDDEEDSELDREESFVAGDLGATWTQRTAMTSDSSPPFSPFDTDAKKSGNEISF